MNWWISKGGHNALLTLSDDLILDFLWRHPQSRHDFEIIVPTMAEEEQQRLQELIDQNPWVKKNRMIDAQTVADNIQSRHNKAGVRTRKPRR